MEVRLYPAEYSSYAGLIRFSEQIIPAAKESPFMSCADVTRARGHLAASGQAAGRTDDSQLTSGQCAP